MALKAKRNFIHGPFKVQKGEVYSGPDGEELLAKGLVEGSIEPQFQAQAKLDEIEELKPKKKKGR